MAGSMDRYLRVFNRISLIVDLNVLDTVQIETFPLSGRFT